MVIESKIYDTVERVLAKYPDSWSVNYYKNKEDVVFKYDKNKSNFRFADYDNEENIITVYGNNYEAIYHELFHMAFRDREKVNKLFTNDTLFGNGVCFRNRENNQKYLVGIVEGFAEYLSRFCTNAYGHTIEFFFVDLLTSIYGEEILEYSLKNDPEGFIMDERFHNIMGIGANLDSYTYAADEIKIMLNFRELLDTSMKNDSSNCHLILNHIRKIMELYNSSIINSFNSLIEEFRACSNPQISKTAYIDKLALLLEDSNYEIAFGFKNIGSDVGKSLQKSLDEFK